MGGNVSGFLKTISSDPHLTDEETESQLTCQGHIQLVVEQREQTPDPLTTTFVFFDVIDYLNSYLKHVWSLDSTTQHIFHLDFKYFVTVIMRVP